MTRKSKKGYRRSKSRIYFYIYCLDIFNFFFVIFNVILSYCKSLLIKKSHRGANNKVCMNVSYKSLKLLREKEPEVIKCLLKLSYLVE